MKILTLGHRYELMNHAKPDEPGQVLQFVENKPVDEKLAGAGCKMVLANDGTTNEEVLVMLIDRIAFLQSRLPCRENAIALTKLEEGLMWLHRRSAGRRDRGVEGTTKL